MDQKIQAGIYTVQEKIEGVLSSSPFLVQQYLKYLLPLDGKYIRTKAILSVAQQEDGSFPEDAYTFSVLVEMIHLASLIHDDVIDDSKLRRGKQTLNTKFGRKTAIICGDYILAKAIHVLVAIHSSDTYRAHDLDSISTCISNLVLGELNQHIQNENYHLKEKEYMEIIEGKTASLFAMTFFLGSLCIPDIQPEQAEIFKQIGLQIGLVFQLLDDCIDYKKTTKFARKPVESDYEQGVITLPLIYTFNQNPQLANQKEKIPFSIIKEEVIRAKGVEKTEEKAKAIAKKTEELIDSLQIQDEKKALLHVYVKELVEALND